MCTFIDMYLSYSIDILGMLRMKCYVLVEPYVLKLIIKSNSFYKETVNMTAIYQVTKW